MTHTANPEFLGTCLRVGWLLLAGLLVLRLVLAGGVGSFFTPRPDWLDSFTQIGIYLLTAGLIWWERERLADFHIDGLAVAIIILFKPIQTLILDFWNSQLSLAFPNPGSLVVWAIALGLAPALLMSCAKNPPPQLKSLGWLVTGTLAGIVAAIALGFPSALQMSSSDLELVYRHRPQLAQVLTAFPVTSISSGLPRLPKSRCSVDSSGDTCASQDGETFGFACFREDCSGLVTSTT